MEYIRKSANYMTGYAKPNGKSKQMVDKRNLYKTLKKKYVHTTSGLTPFEISQMMWYIFWAYDDALMTKGDVSAWDGSVHLSMQLLFYRINQIRCEYSLDEIKAIIANYTFGEIFKVGITSGGVILMILAVMASGSVWTSLQNSDMNFVVIISGLCHLYGFKPEELIVDIKEKLPTLWVGTMGDDSWICGERHNVINIDLARIYQEFGLNGREIDIVKISDFEMLSHRYNYEIMNGERVFYQYKPNRISMLKLSEIWNTKDEYTEDKTRVQELIARQMSYVFNYPFVVELRMMLVFYLQWFEFEDPISFTYGYGDNEIEVMVPSPEVIMEIINGMYRDKGFLANVSADTVITKQVVYKHLYEGYVGDGYDYDEKIKRKYIKRTNLIERYKQYKHYKYIDEICSLYACEETERLLKEYEIE
jgi:hypothetical protein